MSPNVLRCHSCFVYFFSELCLFCFSQLYVSTPQYNKYTKIMYRTKGSSDAHSHHISNTVRNEFSSNLSAIRMCTNLQLVSFLTNHTTSVSSLRRVIHARRSVYCQTLSYLNVGTPV